MFKNKKLDFSKEITTKTTLKKKFIEDAISSLVVAVILYLCLTSFNKDIINIFNAAATENFELDLVLMVLPIVLIVKIMITLGKYIINEG